MKGSNRKRHKGTKWGQKGTTGGGIGQGSTRKKDPGQGTGEQGKTTEPKKRTGEGVREGEGADKQQQERVEGRRQ
jgi:hypothetical protein